MSKEIGFKPGRQVTTQTDFTYSITPCGGTNTISIIDTNQGRSSVTNDIEAILRKIEYFHRDSEGIWELNMGFGEQRNSYGTRSITVPLLPKPLQAPFAALTSGPETLSSCVFYLVSTIFPPFRRAGNSRGSALIASPLSLSLPTW